MSFTQINDYDSNYSNASNKPFYSGSVILTGANQTFVNGYTPNLNDVNLNMVIPYNMKITNFSYSFGRALTSGETYPVNLIRNGVLVENMGPNGDNFDSSSPQDGSYNVGPIFFVPGDLVHFSVSSFSA